MGLVLAILAGVLMWAGFPPLEIPIAPFFSLAILFFLLSSKTLLQRALYSYIAAFSFFAPLLHWSGSYVGWMPWIALTLLQTTLFSIVSLIRFERDAKGAALFAATFTLIELVRMKFPFGGFGWGRVGHTQVDLLAPLYPFLGLAGITFLVVFIPSLLIAVKRKALLSLAILPLIFFLPEPSSSGSIKVAAIQGGVDKLGFDYNERALGVLNRHVERTLTSNSYSELIIWPENASDIDPILDTRAKDAIVEVLEKKKTSLLVGAVLRGKDGPENVSILYNPDGEISSLYSKQDLAPFGEYMPLRTIAEKVAPEAKRVRDFNSGESWITHQVANQKFISVICFEILDDDFIRSGAKDAVFLVAQTNNATFGRSAQAAQQLQIIRSRAAELNRDFAVVSTTGFTAHVDANGSIEKQLVQFEPGELAMNIATYQSQSLASRSRSWLWLGLFVALLLLSGRSVFSR